MSYFFTIARKLNEMTEAVERSENKQQTDTAAETRSASRLRRRVRNALQPPSAGQAENHQPDIQSSAPRRVVTPDLSISNMEEVRDAAAAFIQPGSADPVAELARKEKLLFRSVPQPLENFVEGGVVVKKCFLSTGVRANTDSRFLYLSLQGHTAETAARALEIIATKNPDERMVALEKILPKNALFFDLRPHQALPLVELKQ
jgi:hypothetical protein